MKDDLISRKDAIDALEREQTYCRAFKEGYAHEDIFKKYNMGLSDGIKALKRLPSAEPERKTGRWIQFPSHNAYKCSECGRVIETTDGKNNVCKHYPYCHCGARMGVEHES